MRLKAALTQFALMFTTVIVIAGPAHAAPDDKRTLIQMTFEKVKDIPPLRKKYPALVPILNQIRDDDAQSADAPPTDMKTEIALATISKEQAKTDKDLVFLEVSGAIYCGTSSGCQFHGYAIEPDKSAKDVLNSMAYPVKSFFISRCPTYTSVIFAGGEGIHSGWAEWRYGQSFKYIASYKNLTDLPTCENKIPK